MLDFADNFPKKYHLLKKLAFDKVYNLVIIKSPYCTKKKT